MRNRYKIIILMLMMSFLSIFMLNVGKAEVLGMKNINEEIPEVVKYYDTERIIIIGDSRTYAASQVIDDDDIIFIAKNGATCSYLWETAINEVDKILEQNPKEHFSIFINLGVNDLDKVVRGFEPDGKQVCSAEDYVNYYMELKEKWKDHNLFFESVNPINEKIALESENKYSTNEKVEEFNDYISSQIVKEEMYYCNSYKTLMESGYETKDALHYNEETTKKIISKIKECDLYKKNEKSSYIDPIINQLRAIYINRIFKIFGLKIKIFDYYV